LNELETLIHIYSSFELTMRIRIGQPNGLRYGRLEGRDSLTKRTKPKATKKANLAV
jgi:hypothetical protein